MTVTTAQTVTVDGLVLNTLAYNISTRAGRYTTPDVRTKNVELPGRHGTLMVQGKRFQQGTFTLSMWVRGANSDGFIPATELEYRIFQQNLDLLRQVFTRKSGLLDVRQTMPDGSVRQCFAEVLAAIDPQSKSTRPMAVFSVALVIPSAFWQDLNPITFTSPTGLSSSQTLTLSPFISATAPMDDLVWTIAGAATNPKIQALESGSPLAVDTWVQYNNTVPDFKSLTIDCSQWAVSGVAGFSPSTADVTHIGTSSFMSLQPGPQNTAPQVKWTASGVNADTQLTVTGRRKYVAV